MPPTPVLKTALNYGAISGLCSFAFFLLLYFTGLFPLGPASWLGCWIPVVFMVFGTRHHRDHELNGNISYWTAFRGGFLVATCGGLLFALLLYLFGTVMAPGFTDMFKQESYNALEQTKSITESMLGKGMYDEAVRNIDKITLSSIAFQEFMYKSLGGLLAAFITAAAIRRSNPASIS